MNQFLADDVIHINNAILKLIDASFYTLGKGFNVQD